MIINEKIGVSIALVLILISSVVAATVYTKGLESKIDLIEEREQNHYEELQKDLTRIERKIDALFDSRLDLASVEQGG